MTWPGPERQPLEASDEHQRLPGAEPADLGRPGRGRVGRVHRVDVERAVDGAARQAGELPGHPREPLLLHRLNADDLEPVRLVEREVLGPVERAPDPDLDHAPRVDQALLDGTAERRPVEVLRPEVFVPSVGVRVEVHDAKGAVPAGHRAKHAERDRVVATDADGSGARGHDPGDAALDRLQGPLDRDRDDVDVAVVCAPEPLERVHLEHRVPGAD